MAKPLFDVTETVGAEIADLIPIVPGGIVSKALIDTGACKQILFSMDAGQEISEHKAPFPATVHVLEGELDFDVEGAARRMKAGSWLLMPPDAPHGLRALAPCRFLLTLIKGAKVDPKAACNCA